MDEILEHKWSYLTEGGKHVVFSCENQTWLLRLDKSELVRGRNSKSLESDCTELFLSRHLAPYVSLPSRFWLPASVARQLVEEALGCGRIPEVRRADWFVSDETNDGLVGQLVKDARIWHSHVYKEETNHQPWSVEIKPKAGYRTTSPLVHPQRRMKYQVSRFRLLQQLKSQSTAMKPISGYNPWDLFSGDFDRIQNAIQELIKCPNNNLKVWKARHSCDIHERTSLSIFVQMTSTVLFKEPCLAKVLEIQRLDILDGDGAILLYEHLVNLCHGQDSTAIQLIDSPWSSASDRHVSILQGSPIYMESATCALTTFCEKMESFSQTIDEAWPKFPTSMDLDKERDIAVNLFRMLDLEDSVFLLQNWILSLCLCDISIFITFHCVSNTEHKFDSIMKTLEGVTCVCTIDRLQQEDVPGLLTVTSDGIKNQTEDEVFQFEYCINIIDYDQKPASKLKTRLLKEIGFNGLEMSGFEMTKDVEE